LPSNFGWDSALSKQPSTLERAGYAEIRKWFIGKRPRTSARLTARRGDRREGAGGARD